MLKRRALNRLLESNGVKFRKTRTDRSRRGDGNCGGRVGGRDRDRTCDLMLAKHALSQLSYTPIFATVIV
jgi:hypothetical protein